MRPLVVTGDPADVARREWVVALDPPALHARAIKNLRGRAGSTITRVGFFGITMEPPAPVPLLLPVVTDVLAELRGNQTTLHRAVEILERLTIGLEIRLTRPASSAQRGPRSKRGDGDPAIDLRLDRLLVARELRVSDLLPDDSFEDRWVRWCRQSGRPLLDLLVEYDYVKNSLAKLADPWPVLRRAASGHIRIDAWSCELPRSWLKSVDPDWAPSQWAEFLLSLKRGINLAYLKDDLRDARVERRIAAAWTAYGKWLPQHDDALHELGAALGVSITVPASTRSL